MAEPSAHNTYARGEMPEHPVAEPTVDMDSLGGFIESQVQGPYAGEALVGLGEESEEPTPETPASPPEERAAAPEKAEEVEALREELRQMRESFSRPQERGFDEGQLARSFAQALRMSRQMDRQEEASKPPEPPRFFEGKVDVLADDPDQLGSAIDGATRRAAQWGYERAMEAVQGAWGQQAQGLQQIQGFLTSVAPAMEEMAREKAQAFGESAGYFADEKHRDEVMARAGQLLASQNDATLRYRPEGWRTALQYLRDNDPALVKAKPKSPPSAGDGDANPIPSAGRPRVENHPDIRLASMLAGRKPTADEMEAFQKVLR